MSEVFRLLGSGSEGNDSAWSEAAKAARGLTYKIAALFFVSLLLCEVHIFILKRWPETQFIQYDLWLSKSYHEKLTVVWYMYELELVIAKVIWVFIIARLSYFISFKLFKVMLVFVAYFITQFLFYIWDRNTSLISNVIVYAYMVLALIFLLIPDKKSKIINL